MAVRLSALRTVRFLPPGNTPGIHSSWRLSRPQGHSAIGRILCQWKIPMAPSGIEPATFQFVAQSLNHCATAVPRKPCSTATKQRYFGGISVLTLLLVYVLIRALRQALQSPLLGVACHFGMSVISTWCKNLGLYMCWLPTYINALHDVTYYVESM